MTRTKLFKSVVPAVVLGLLTLGLTSTLASAVTPSGSNTTSKTIAVSVTVADSCTIATNPLAFGTYVGTTLNGTTTLTVTCSASGAIYAVGLDKGLGSGATDQARVMTGPSSATLNYNLYADSPMTVDWGNTSTTNWQTYTVATGNVAQTAATVYGQIPASQVSVVGNYADTVTATVTY
jgi:spore coat protein U-like protein